MASNPISKCEFQSPNWPDVDDSNCHVNQLIRWHWWWNIQSLTRSHVSRRVFVNPPLPVQPLLRGAKQTASLLFISQHPSQCEEIHCNALQNKQLCGVSWQCDSYMKSNTPTFLIHFQLSVCNTFILCSSVWCNISAPDLCTTPYEAKKTVKRGRVNISAPNYYLVYYVGVTLVHQIRIKTGQFEATNKGQKSRPAKKQWQ